MKNFLHKKGLAAAHKTVIVITFIFFALVCQQSVEAQTAQPNARRHITHNQAKHKTLVADSMHTAKLSARALKYKTVPVDLKEKIKQTYLKSRQHKVTAANIKKLLAGNVTYTIINTGTNTYGYDVYNNGRKIIHQPVIPGVAGHAGFTSKEDAEKVAQLVTGKMKSGQMPPAVTAAELRTLNIAVR